MAGRSGSESFLEQLKQGASLFGKGILCRDYTEWIIWFNKRLFQMVKQNDLRGKMVGLTLCAKGMDKNGHLLTTDPS
jgi:hypothetical protein